MCISATPGDFSNTQIFMGRLPHPEDQYREVEVMLYQNHAQSFVGANALILHVPTTGSFGPENFLDFSNCPSVLDDMVDAVRPRSRGLGTRSFGDVAKSVQIFDVGLYTVVLSTKASLIDQALQQVHASKRPIISVELLEFYEQSFPGWPLAVCCFNNAGLTKSQPIGVWYDPMFPDMIRAPGLDAHTGGAPDLTRPVDVDHWIFVSVPNMQRHTSQPVYYRDQIPQHLNAFLPRNVMGFMFKREWRNGDFCLPIKAASQGSIEHGMLRVQPGDSASIPPGAAG